MILVPSGPATGVVTVVDGVLPGIWTGVEATGVAPASGTVLFPGSP
jgi:hypothetical protein